jgi:predicted XRE-type DNA-binding protein
MASKRKATKSSGNVFEDLGLPNSEELAVKADLVAAIIRAIKASGFKNQSEAATRMGIDQPRVSKLIRGHFDDYSVERLMEFLAVLGNDVEIRVRHHRNEKPGHIRVRECQEFCVRARLSVIENEPVLELNC